MKNYYYILGVEFNASIDEIKKAYRRLSKKFHPDTNNEVKAEEKQFFEERFKAIQEAYEVLSDPTRKAKYDEQYKQFFVKQAYQNSQYHSYEEEIQKEYELINRTKEELRRKENELRKREEQVKQREDELKKKTNEPKEPTPKKTADESTAANNNDTTKKPTIPYIVGIGTVVAIVAVLVLGHFVSENYREKRKLAQAEQNSLDSLAVAKQQTDSLKKAQGNEITVSSKTEKTAASLKKAQENDRTNSSQITNSSKEEKPQNILDEIAANMIYVQGGTYQMGCDDSRDENCTDNEKPVHSVSVSSFYMSKFEVTQAQWKAVMGTNPSRFVGCDNCPVEGISWNDIQGFLKKLNQAFANYPLSKGGQGGFRLPTEEEWEYAARGGQKSQNYKYAGSNDIGSVAWYHGNSGLKTHAVGSKKANELGLYDMSGNVHEWTNSDWSADYIKNRVNTYVVLRGGSWFSGNNYCRMLSRDFDDPLNGGFNLGFRLLRIP